VTIALVSCGPSAAGFEADGHEGPIIAVSRAATIVRADTWACFDLPVALEFGSRIIGAPKLFTVSNTFASLRRRNSPWLESAMVAENLVCPVWRWTLFTAPAALVHAAEMGATRIDAWGVDMKGVGDVTGDPGADRSEARWAKERTIWNEIVDWLTPRCCVVCRRY
jgi:hypothetical protein